MNISMEQIDEMRKRTNCSYQEAKELLEKNNGDLLEAIVEFEKKYGYKEKNKHQEKKERKGKIKGLIRKGFKTRFIIEKDKTIILNISINLLILVVLITMPALWIYPVIFIVLYLLGYKIRIIKEEGRDLNINEMVDELGSKVKAATEKMCEKPSDEGCQKDQRDYNDQGNPNFRSSQNDQELHPEDKTENNGQNSKDRQQDADGYNEITVDK